MPTCTFGCAKAEAGTLTDYLPISLASICNVGVSVFGHGQPPALGSQTMRGIPFEVGDDADRCYVRVDAGRPARVLLPVPTPARWIVFAHRVVDSQVLAGEPVGQVVGQYRFRFEDGRDVVVPIRERFEVSIAQTTAAEWGQLPMLALPSRFDALPPRCHGSFAATGHRLTEVQLLPVELYLWAWDNPHPADPIVALQFEGTQGVANLVVAGVTLGLANEHPLRLPPAQPVKIDLLDAHRDHRSELTLSVDRGVATFTQVLPESPLLAPADDPMFGWGRERNLQGHPVYSSIAAQSSATLSVFDDGDLVGEAPWRELESSRAVETSNVRIEVLETGRNWVRTSVVDDATGRPVPCRIHMCSSQGVPYQPYGHPNHLNSDLYEYKAKLGVETGAWGLNFGGDVRLGGVTYAYIDGTCQGWLPRGEVVVDVARGFECEPARHVVTIRPGQRDVEIRLRRRSDISHDGWFSGDTHVHFLSVPSAHLEAQGEDVNVVNLLATQWGGMFSSTDQFAGTPNTSGDGRTIVYVSQENRQHLLGHLSLLGLTEPVMPWCTDGPPEAEMGGALETVLAHWADRCHEQGGLVVLPHFPNPNGEPAALVATGRVDAVEFAEFRDYSHQQYYMYLNAGYRLPLVGGTDKMSGDVPIGLSRTYARLLPGESFSYAAWCRAITAGRTFMSSGPLMSLRIDGRLPGDTVQLSRGGGTVHVEAEATSIFPIHTLEIVQGGRVVASSSMSEGGGALKIVDSVHVINDTWLAARVAGPRYSIGLRHRDEWSRGVMAHTSPVYVACNDEWRPRDAAASMEMLTMVDGGLQYIRQLGPRWHDHHVTHHHGEADHLAYLERPFLEAQRAIRARLSTSW